MKFFYIFLSLAFIFLFSNGIAFAQNQKSNQKTVHKTIDKMNYEFALAVLKRMNQLDENVKFSTQKLKDTTFTQVEKLKPRVQAQSLERLFSDKKLSDGVTGYIYDIDFIKKSSKYPTDDLPSTIKSLDKIVSKILIRTNDFGDKQSKFKLTPKQLSDLKLRLNKIKNSAVNGLNPNEEGTIVQADTTQTDSTLQAGIKEESAQIDSIKIIYYRINEEEKKELIGNVGGITRGKKPTYKFGLDIKSTDSVRFYKNKNSVLDTLFLASDNPLPVFLENESNIYMIDLNVTTTEEDDYIMWIIFGVIAISVITFVIYKQSQKDKATPPEGLKKEVAKIDPLSRNDTVTKTVISTNQNTENEEKKTVIAQNQNQTENQIQEEKKRLTTLLTNSNLSDTQKLKEARSKNVIIEVANNSEVKELMRVIEELSTKSNTAKEAIKDQPNKEEITTQKTLNPPKNTKNYHEPLYVSLSDINKMGIKSERKKGMSNTIFMIRPYSEGETEAKKADLMLHSDIKDMAFESIFRSIEKLDYIIEYNTLDQNVKKITQKEKGELIKEDNVWKVKKRLKVKFS
ncbi:hypothetical protein Fleli_1801 [Bernardetia litoralis DSM 6794]|uniref:Uncharacterized protein n=1 Tax=Bernardetia litoralis (strain ATCC 23117 / DSM 6794 / NBRC 15988 / NCIMB 1366 / Fx l1 / Sio-4) TaxID=880071 RepID=I4AJR4_BERLS|nr:hypothetical protein [Bernardetia litoralis]AFM04199.1 hypothetical protein Fleli_1801 [Bernardetia litoralis DSM 6794]